MEKLPLMWFPFKLGARTRKTAYAQGVKTRWTCFDLDHKLVWRTEKPEIYSACIYCTFAALWQIKWRAESVKNKRLKTVEGLDWLHYLTFECDYYADRCDVEHNWFWEMITVTFVNHVWDIEDKNWSYFLRRLGVCISWTSPTFHVCVRHDSPARCVWALHRETLTAGALPRWGARGWTTTPRGGPRRPHLHERVERVIQTHTRPLPDGRSISLPLHQSRSFSLPPICCSSCWPHRGIAKRN